MERQSPYAAFGSMPTVCSALVSTASISILLLDLQIYYAYLLLTFSPLSIGYPVVTLGFGFKSYVGYRMRQRKQREVAKENEFYMQLLQQALPAEETNEMDAHQAGGVAPVVTSAASGTVVVANGGATAALTAASSQASSSSQANGILATAATQAQNHHEHHHSSGGAGANGSSGSGSSNSNNHHHHHHHNNNNNNNNTSSSNNSHHSKDNNSNSNSDSTTSAAASAAATSAASSTSSASSSSSSNSSAASASLKQSQTATAGKGILYFLDIPDKSMFIFCACSHLQWSCWRLLQEQSSKRGQGQASQQSSRHCSRQ